MKNTLSVLSLVLAFSMSASAAYAATITNQLDIGDTGQDVSTLQTYLSTDSNIYPSHLVTGYFGVLTEGGVQKFQVAQGIVSGGTAATTGYGRVGPSTMARLNQAMNSVNTNNTSTLYTVPVLSSLNIQRGSTTLTFSWTTNEPTTGQVYWSTGGIRADEATGPNQTPYVSGTLALDAGGLQYSHTITVSNLLPNTVYTYFVRSIDAQGDVSVILPSTVLTTQ